MSHQVDRANVSEGIAHSDLHEAFLCRAQKEPSDECGPQTVDPVSVQCYPDPSNDHHIRKNLSRRGCDFRGTREIPGNSPCNTPKNAATVEGKSRNKVEGGQKDIDLPQPDGRRVNHIVPVKIARHEPEAGCEKHARKRT